MTDTPPPFRLGSEEFAALAAGGGDAAVVARLRRANRSRTLLAIAFLAARTRRAGHPDAGAVARAYQVLTDARATRPEEVWRVLDQPEVALWAVGAARDLVHGGDRCRPGALANVAAAAAVRAGTPADLVTAAGPFPLPSLGTLGGVGTRLRLRQDGDGALTHTGVRIVPGGATPDWSPLSALRLGDRTVTLDQWRLVALPGPFAATLSRAPDLPAWRAVLTGAVDVLDAQGVAGPVLEAVRTVTPLRDAGADPSSATLSEAFGAVLLSLPRGPRQAALTLVHEVQHAKLTVLHDLFPLLETGARERFYAPWRRDPRPLLGLLHGAYAYVGVVGFWRQQRLLDTDPADAHDAEVEFARWLPATRETVEVLATRPELTAHGHAFVAGLAGTLADWSAEPTDPAARAEADHLRRDHRDRWYRAS